MKSIEQLTGVVFFRARNQDQGNSCSSISEKLVFNTAFATMASL